MKMRFLLPPLLLLGGVKQFRYYKTSFYDLSWTMNTRDPVVHYRKRVYEKG